MDTFYEDVMRRINLKIAEEDEKGCKLWRKGRSTTTNPPYPKIGLKFPGQQKKTYYVHRVIYMCYNRMADMQNKELEVSHLCHNKRCCSLQHLNLEPHYVNSQRETCKRNKKCCGHGVYSACIF